MAYTYLQLQAEVARWLAINNDPNFTASFPGYVRQAEERIYNVARIQPYRQKTTGVAHTAGVVATPNTFVAPISIVMTSLNGVAVSVPLLPKQEDYIAELYGPTATGTPVFYAISTTGTDTIGIVVAPTPATAALFTINYFGKPTSLVDTADPGTTWISRNAETTLLQGTLYYAYLYEKGEDDMLKQYADQFEKGLLLLKGVAAGLLRRDEFRVPQKSVEEQV